MCEPSLNFATSRMLKFSPYHTKIFEDLEKKCVNKNPASVVVIGAGFSRTGTFSLKSALTELLGARCYHGVDYLAGDQEDLDI